MIWGIRRKHCCEISGTPSSNSVGARKKNLPVDFCLRVVITGLQSEVRNKDYDVIKCSEENKSAQSQPHVVCRL